MSPATATEGLDETPKEWRTRRSAELREQYRAGADARNGPSRVAILQSEEALWWGFERGLEEQRELVRELRDTLYKLQTASRLARDAVSEGRGLNALTVLLLPEVEARALLDRTEAQR